MGQFDTLLVRKDVDLLIAQMPKAEVELYYIPGWGHSGVMFPKTNKPFLKLLEVVKRDLQAAGVSVPSAE